MAAAGGAAHRLVASDELGTLKAVDVPAGPRWSDAVVQRWGQPDRAAAVACMASTSGSLEPGTPALVAVARPGARVDIFKAVDGQLVGSCSSAEPGRSPPAVRALRFVSGGGGDGDGDSGGAPLLRLISCSADGAVQVHAAPADWDAAEAAAAGPVPWALSIRFITAAGARCLALGGEPQQLAVGGEGCHLALWDLQTGKQLWSAKGGKPNRVGLVDLPHTTALAALPGGRWVAGTHVGKLLLYDPRAGRRPQLTVTCGGSPVTALAAQADGARVWAANGAGTVAALDVAAGRMQGSLKGSAGSVRSLALHPTQPLVASAGLDRFLRVHSTATRACMGRVYLKQQLTGVAWVPPPELPPPPPASEERAAAGAEGEAPGADDGTLPSGGGDAKAHKAGGKRKAVKTDGKHRGKRIK